MGQSEMLKAGYIWPKVGWKLLPILLINFRENKTIMFFIDFRYVGIMIILDNLEIITQGAKCLWWNTPGKYIKIGVI